MDRLFKRREPAPPPTPEVALEPIRLFAHEVEAAGWVKPGDERLTDLLQRGDELAFLPDGADPANPQNWVSIVTDSLLIVVPPPHVSPPERRLPRHEQRVMVSIGPYRVIGTAHLRPGFEQDIYLRATHPFLPLTDATVAGGHLPDEVGFEVVIIKLSEIEQLKEL